jgi:hypothetical protein
MSAQTTPMVDASPAAPRVGLWSEKWFRVLTIFNSSVLTVSALAGVVVLLGDSPNFWLVLSLPVVPAAIMMPWPWLFVFFAAAAFSCLNMIGDSQKTVRFLRAMTVWGTIVLGAPLVTTAIVGSVTAISALVSLIGSLW